MPEEPSQAEAASRRQRRQLGRVTCWRDFIAIARQRTLDLNVAFETVDLIAGVTDGYTSKLLSNERQFSEMSFDAVFGALGLDFVAVESRDKMRRIEKRLVHRKTTTRMHSADEHAPIKFKLTHKFMRKIARLAAAGRLRRIPPAQRSEIARRAALARWQAIRERKQRRAERVIEHEKVGHLTG